MKKRNLLFVIVNVLIVSSFFGIKLEVYAESYIAKSAPDSFVTNTTRWSSFYSSDNICSMDLQGRDALLTTNSFISEKVGTPYPIWPNVSSMWKNKDYYYIYDTHVKDSEDRVNDASIPGDKFFLIDDMYYRTGTMYSKVEDAVDYGIVYIISNAQNYLNRNGLNVNARPNGKLEASWFTQVALWKYQNIRNFSNISMTSNDIVEHKPAMLSSDCDGTITIDTVSSSAVTLWNLADGLVNEVKKTNSTSFTFHYDGNYTLLDDKQKVKTSIISMPDSSSVSSYSLDISKAPLGTKVYNDSNALITNLTNIASNTKFYLEIPVENVENFTYDFNITASVMYRYKGYKYKTKVIGEGQDVSSKINATSLVLVVNEPQQIEATLKFNATHIEDSASSISKMVYIGGLFILLCGVALVYVNMKPRKQES